MRFKRIIPFLIILTFSTVVFSQKDSLPYEMYNKKVVLYADIGYSSAPFSISYNFPGNINKINYRNNYKEVLGYGICYKWFSLRLFRSSKGNAKSEEIYGKTDYFGVGFNFNAGKSYWDIDLRSFRGYALKNAYQWNSALTPQLPNDIRPNTTSIGFSINSWYFYNKNFKIQAVLGKTGHFIKEVRSWYLKTTFNIYGISNGQHSLIPNQLTDPNNSKTSSPYFSALDFGVIPGYAYANRINNWQITGLFGLGAVIQNKHYAVGENGSDRGLLGLAPRYDIKLVGGYSVPKFFLFLITDFDNKSIRFNDLIYKQSFYSIKLLGGFRFNTKESKKNKKKNNRTEVNK